MLQESPSKDVSYTVGHLIHMFGGTRRSVKVLIKCLLVLV